MNILPLPYLLISSLILPYHIPFIQPSGSKPEPYTPLSTPHTRAVENSGLNRSPESSLRTPLSHQTRLIREHSSRMLSSRHRALISLSKVPNIHIMMTYIRKLTPTNMNGLTFRGLTGPLDQPHQY